MAKKSMVAREVKRRKMIAKYATLREELKKTVVDLNASDEDRWQAVQKLQALPRNSCPIRSRNRCRLTGRPRGTYRRFGLGRNMLRIHAMKGDIPGLVKASW